MVGADKDYITLSKMRVKLSEFVAPFTEADVHRLPDVGNKPSYAFILRNRTWQGAE